MRDDASTPTSRTGPASVCVLTGGGLDSCVLLARMAAEYGQVHPLFIRCGLLWEGPELAALRAFLAGADPPRRTGVGGLTVLHAPMDTLYGDHWSISGRRVPDARTPDEAVYLPGRNLVFLTQAAILCSVRRIGTIALGPLHSNPFPDASDAFFRAFERAAGTALDTALRIVTPFLDRHKHEVIRLGHEMGLPLERTFSCIDPSGDRHCGRCNKCHERREAFALAHLPDPTHYAD